MEIILREDYPQLGYVGDVVRVRDGFARNYLIPQGIALPYNKNKKSRKEIEHLLRGIEAKKNKLKILAQEKAEKLNGLELEFTLKLGEKGKAFGSITSKDIADKINELGEVTLSRKQVRIKEAIKTPGKHIATISLHSEVSVEVGLTVEGVIDKKLEQKAKKQAQIDEQVLEANAEEDDQQELEAEQETSEE